MGERLPINPAIQVQFRQQMKIFFRPVAIKNITLVNGMPSTAKMRKRVLHSLSEQKTNVALNKLVL